MNVLNRAEEGQCLCCLGKVTTHATLTSAFLSQRAWGGGVEWSSTSKCRRCGFAFHGRGLRPEEAASYYRGYRDEEYFRARNSHEPFYTRKFHDVLDAGADRRAALRQYLSRFSINGAGVPADFAILDYGGGKGRLISEIQGRRFVYDLSGETPVDGVKAISAAELESETFDLVVCAQMLEHATDPYAVAAELLRLVKPGGHLYVEVPYDETWRDLSMDGKLRRLVLSQAKRSRRFNMVLDIYGTAFRLKLKVLPPLAFVPVREHLNFFTPPSLVALGQRLQGEVVDASRVTSLGTTLLLRRPSP